MASEEECICDFSERISVYLLSSNIQLCQSPFVFRSFIPTSQKHDVRPLLDIVTPLMLGFVFFLLLQALIQYSADNRPMYCSVPPIPSPDLNLQGKFDVSKC